MTIKFNNDVSYLYAIYTLIVKILSSNTETLARLYIGYVAPVHGVVSWTIKSDGIGTRSVAVLR